MDTDIPIALQSSSFSPVLSPYIHPIGQNYRHYEQRLTSNMYDSPRKKQLRSPINDLHQEGMRGSVLRDGSKANRSSPSPSGRGGYRPGSSSSSSQPGIPTSVDVEQIKIDKVGSPHPARYEDGKGNGNGSNNGERSETGGNNAAFDSTAAGGDEREDGKGTDQGFAEDLRIKMETEYASGNGGSVTLTPSGTPGNGTGFGGGGVKIDSTLPPHVPPSEMLNSNLWNTSKLTGHKAGSVATADGKKLKCPYCDRLYGYETNLRAHIRQRHQGIRVPCPFCSRTFTRNNTVRRHIAREHKQEMTLKQYQQSQLQNHSQ